MSSVSGRYGHLLHENFFCEDTTTKLKAQLWEQRTILGFAVVGTGAPHGQFGSILRCCTEISWGTAKVLKHFMDKGPSSSLLAATAVLSACLSILAVSPIL